MGTLTTWNAESLADQTTLTTGNVPANQVNVGSSPAYAKASTTAALLGTRGYEISMASTGTSSVRLACTSNLVQGGQFLWRIDSGNNRRFWSPRHASGDVFRLSLNGSLATTVSTGAGGSVLTGPTLTVGTVYIVDWLATVATTTTGQLSVRFSTTSGSVVGTISSTTYNLGTAAIAFLDMGSGSDASTGASTYSYDNIRVEDGRTTYLSSPFPGSATATGNTAWSGSAAGARTPKATATGNTTWTGSATGKRTPKATPVGDTAWTGTAVGTRTPKATADGTTSWSGTAVGKRTPTGTAAGTTSWTGTAAGTRAPKAAATGTTTWTGSAAGTRAPSTTATGTTAWTGTAAGTRTPKATTTGTTAWSGTAVGATPELGQANATATGTTSWTGAADGKRTPIATTSGTTTWTGTASGQRVPVAAAVGATEWTGAATGVRNPTATADGTTTWTGTAAGAQPRQPRDVTVLATLGPRTSTATLEARRWTGGLG
jgi:hypothetical protein